MGVYFTANIKLHLVFFHVSALMLSPLTAGVYLFFQMLLIPSGITLGTLKRIHLIMLWIMLLIYAILFFFLVNKRDNALKEGHVVFFLSIYMPFGAHLQTPVGQMALSFCRFSDLHPIYRNLLERCGGKRKLQPLLCNQYRLQNDKYMRCFLEYARENNQIRLGQEVSGITFVAVFLLNISSCSTKIIVG